MHLPSIENAFRFLLLAIALIVSGIQFLSMLSPKKTVLALAIFLAASSASLRLVTLCRANSSPEQGPPQPASSSSTARPVGTIKAIAGNAITLTSDTGSDVNVLVQVSTRIIRTAPGQKDLKDATPVQLQELQAGDRILVRGNFSDDAKSVVASSIIAMKRSDVEAKREQDREDWQKRGVGGLVSAVDTGSGAITISSDGPSASKAIAIHTSKDTILRRYAPDSVRFDDARPSTLDQIKPGDQLRARGTRSANEAEFAAEEIVSGAFRNIAGTIATIDAPASTVSVIDMLTKKPVLVRITAESQLRKLPPGVAERVAIRLKGPPRDAPPAAAPAGARAPVTRAAGEPPSGGTAGTSGPDGPQDLQHLMNRMLAVALADFQKGDAVMIVSTQGVASSGVTAITLLGGVEPILVASPNGSHGMILSPWDLGSSVEAEK